MQYFVRVGPQGGEDAVDSPPGDILRLRQSWSPVGGH